MKASKKMKTRAPAVVIDLAAYCEAYCARVGRAHAQKAAQAMLNLLVTMGGDLQIDGATPVEFVQALDLLTKVAKGTAPAAPAEGRGA